MKNEVLHGWDNTVSGRIYSYLQEKFSDKGLLQIENQGEPIEVITFNNEQAHILKRGYNGDNVQHIFTAIESYEYKRLPWWQEAINAQKGVDFTLLDPPLMWVAKDAGVEAWEGTFRPSSIIQQLQLTAGLAPEQIEELKSQVRSIIIEVVNPLVQPAYSVILEDGGLRLSAITNEAMESRFIDNETYHTACKAIKSTVPILLERYHSGVSP